MKNNQSAQHFLAPDELKSTDCLSGKTQCKCDCTYLALFPVAIVNRFISWTQAYSEPLHSQHQHRLLFRQMVVFRCYTHFALRKLLTLLLRPHPKLRLQGWGRRHNIVQAQSDRRLERTLIVSSHYHKAFVFSMQHTGVKGSQMFFFPLSWSRVKFKLLFV